MGVFALAVNAGTVVVIIAADPQICDCVSVLCGFHVSSLSRRNLDVVGVIRSTWVIDAGGKIEKAMYNVKATGHVAKLRRDLGID